MQVPGRDYQGVIMSQVGISVHDSLMVADPARRRALLSMVETAGLDYVCVGDHVSFHDGTGFDGLTAATAALSGSDRLPVLVGVYLLALRHPLLTARQLASVSQLAPGRLVLGAGVGGEDRSEVSNSGVDPATRGRRLDECLQVLRALASGDAVDHQGSSSSSRPRASSRRPSSDGRFRPGTASTRGVGLPPTPRRPGCCWPGRWRACTICRSENSSGWPRPAPRPRWPRSWCPTWRPEPSTSR